MKRTALARKTPLTAKASLRTKTPLKATRRPAKKLRKGTIHRAINPESGRVIAVKGAKERAWRAFAAYIRARDPQCITCGNPTTEAGHFLHNSDKTNKQLGGNELWYNEQNVNGQEGVCNRHHSGKGAVYAVKLEEKYGPGTVARLYKLFTTPKKWTIPELLEVERIYLRKLALRQIGDNFRGEGS